MGESGDLFAPGQRWHHGRVVRKGTGGMWKAGSVSTNGQRGYGPYWVTMISLFPRTIRSSGLAYGIAATSSSKIGVPRPVTASHPSAATHPASETTPRDSFPPMEVPKQPADPPSTISVRPCSRLYSHGFKNPRDAFPCEERMLLRFPTMAAQIGAAALNGC